MSSQLPIQEDSGSDESGQYLVLQLFVTGVSLNSVRAIANIKHICDQYRPGNYGLEIIDVHQHKELAEREQLIALPLLIKRLPLPERRLIGDLSDTKKVLAGLGITKGE